MLEDAAKIFVCPAEDPRQILMEIGALRAQPTRVASIAGFDSLAAVVLEAQASQGETILPTIVLTGTEYGDITAPLRAIAALRIALNGIADVLNPVWLSSPRLWHALNGRYMAPLMKKYPGWSPCAACHLYVHACRIPLLWGLGSPSLIVGDRLSHDGKTKLSQLGPIMEAEFDVFRHAGIVMSRPLRSLSSTHAIAELTGLDDAASVGFLECLLSGNYLGGEDAQQRFEDSVESYAGDFLIPFGRALVDAWRIGDTIDYFELVHKVIVGEID